MYLTDFSAWAILLSASLALCLVWLGWGRLLDRFAPKDLGPLPRVLLRAWTGWALGTLFLHLWHFFRPVDAWTAACLAAVGLLGLRGSRIPAWRTWPRLPFLLGLLASLAIVRWFRGEQTVYDAGMYYLPTLRWINEFPVVPGLGNLNMQLGTNGSYHLWAAVLNLHPLWRSGFLVINLLAALLVLAPGLHALCHAPAASDRPLWFLRLCILPAATYAVTRDNANQAASDYFAWMLSMAAFEGLCAWHLSLPKAARPLPVGAMLMVASLPTVKLSLLLYAVGLYLLVLPSGPICRAWLRACVPAFGIGLAVALPWMAHGIVLTGYPLFPSTVLAADVDWRVPAYKVDFSRHFIRVWALAPDPAGKPFVKRMKEWEHSILSPSLDVPPPRVPRDPAFRKPWVPGWFRGLRQYRVFLLCLAVCIVSLPALAVKFRRRNGNIPRGLSPWHAAMFIPLLLALGFWGMTAPSIRFGLPYWILLAAWTASLALPSIAAWPKALSVALRILLLALALAPWTVLGIKRAPGWADIVFAPIPRANMSTFTTKSGLVLNVPRRGALAQDSPLPNTPFRNAFLVLRDPDKGLAAGFRDETPPQLWPID